MEKDDTDKNGSLRKEQRAKNRFIKTSFDTNGDGNKWLQNGLAKRRPALDAPWFTSLPCTCKLKKVLRAADRVSI